MERNWSLFLRQASDVFLPRVAQKHAGSCANCFGFKIIRPKNFIDVLEYPCELQLQDIVNCNHLVHYPLMQTQTSN